MNDDFFDVLFGGGVFGVIILMVYAVAILWAGVFTVVNLSTENRCLSLGYASGKATYTFGQYCVVRELQTDVVVPLSEARRRPRR